MESASMPDAAIGRNIFQCLASGPHGCQEKKWREREKNNGQFTTNEIDFAKKNIKYVFKCQLYYFVENNKIGDFLCSSRQGHTYPILHSSLRQ